MMLRMAPVSPNKVVVPPSLTRIPIANAFAAPRHQLVTRKAPNFISLRCSNVDTNNSILTKPLKSKINFSPIPPKCPVDFPFRVEGRLLSREHHTEGIYATITSPRIIKEDMSEFKSNGGVCLPEGLFLIVEIRKGNGMSVTFGVTLWPHDMEVHFFTVKSIGMSELKIEIKEKEPGKLASTLQEYLKVRGIKPCYAKYLYRHMVYLYMRQKSNCCPIDD